MKYYFNSLDFQYVGADMNIAVSGIRTQDANRIFRLLVLLVVPRPGHPIAMEFIAKP